MNSVSDAFLFFAPIVLLVAIFVSITAIISLKSEKGARAFIALVLWSLISLVWLMFTVAYLIGPDCVFCYDPPKRRLAVEFVGGVLVYGTIGFVLWWLVRKRDVKK